MLITLGLYGFRCVTEHDKAGATSCGLQVGVLNARFVCSHSNLQVCISGFSCFDPISPKAGSNSCCHKGGFWQRLSFCIYYGKSLGP